MIFLIVLSVLSTQTAAFTLNCNFIIDSQAGYTCQAVSTSITNLSDRSIERVTGTHLKGKNNGLVTIFLSNITTLNYLPVNLKVVFPNLNVLSLIRADLKEIFEDDLTQFGEDLIVLEVPDNKLQSLDYDIFKNTPNIENLDLSANKIKYVQDGIFDSLRNLQFFNFVSNPCHSAWAIYGDTHDEIDNLIKTIETKCKNIEYIIEKSNYKLLDFINSVRNDFYEFTEYFKYVVDEIGEKSDENTRNLQQMMAYGLSDLKNNIGKL